MQHNLAIYTAKVFASPPVGSTVKFAKTVNSAVCVSVYNSTGQLVGSQIHDVLKSGSQLLSLNLSFLEEGMYYINVISNEKTKVLKFVKK